MADINDSDPNVEPYPYTTNGLPMTEDFDVAFYVKGDRKSTVIYSAKLVLEYEGEEPGPAPTEADMAVTSVSVPSRTTLAATETVEVVVTNNGPAVASGGITLQGVSNRGDNVMFSSSFEDLAEGGTEILSKNWTNGATKPSTFNWTATVTSASDPNPSNDSATAQTKVRRN